MNALVPIFYIDETSGEYIDKKAGEYGLTRKPGAKATVTLNFTGSTGTTIPAGSSFLTTDGLEYKTNETVTLADGIGSVRATAAAEGAAYNVAAATIVSAKIVIGGLSATTNPQAASGGIDPESDEALVKRFYSYLRQPPTSGNVYQYKMWALAVTGVGYAKVLSLWNGAGTVKVLLAGADGKAVGASVVSAAETAIEAERPIGAAVTVASASEKVINIAATISIDSSTTKATVKAELEKVVGDYLKSLIFESYTVNFNRISYLLLSISGVTDYSALTVNSGSGNITVGAEEIPVLGSVVIS